MFSFKDFAHHWMALGESQASLRQAPQPCVRARGMCWGRGEGSRARGTWSQKGETDRTERRRDDTDEGCALRACHISCPSTRNNFHGKSPVPFWVGFPAILGLVFPPFVLSLPLSPSLLISPSLSLSVPLLPSLPLIQTTDAHADAPTQTHTSITLCLRRAASQGLGVDWFSLSVGGTEHTHTHTHTPPWPFAFDALAAM